MTFLPIVERELRVRARSKAWHWMKFGVVAAGASVSGLMWGSMGGPAEVGRGVFMGLVATGFLACCGACLVTADVISSERREGTLILLFLTRIKDFDLLLGKLASAGLPVFCSLVACAPLLIIPILAGGVTGGEAVRKSLVLMDTMFVALTAGLWASARGREWFKRARAAALMLGTIVLAPAIGTRFCGVSNYRAGFPDLYQRMGRFKELVILSEFCCRCAARCLSNRTACVRSLLVSTDQPNCIRSGIDQSFDWIEERQRY
jgi:hypothetical protein